MSTPPSKNATKSAVAAASASSVFMVWLLLGFASGACIAVFVLPAWLPGLGTSLLGPEPKAYWYLSRAAGLVSYVLLWLSMVLGLWITNKLARVWPGGPTVFDLHQFASLLSLGFTLFHALILLGDPFMDFMWLQVAVPFTNSNYRPFAVGLGQIGFYASAIVGFSFYVRSMLGHRRWRLIHFLSYATFLLALGHGLLSGTDSGVAWIRAMYWATGGSVLFLTFYRLLVRLQAPIRTQPV